MFRYQISLFIFLAFVGLQALLHLPQFVEKKTGMSAHASLREVKERLDANFALPTVNVSVSETFQSAKAWAGSLAPVDFSLPSVTLPSFSQFLPDLFWLELFGLSVVALGCVLCIWFIVMDAHSKALDRREQIDVLNLRIARLEQALHDKPTVIIDMTAQEVLPVQQVDVASEAMEVVESDSPSATEFLVREVSAVVEALVQKSTQSVSLEVVALITMVSFDLRSALSILTRENFSPVTIGQVLERFDTQLETTLEVMFKPESRIALEIRTKALQAVNHNLHALYEIHLDHESKLAA